MEASKRNLQAWEGSLYELGVTWTEDGIPKDLSTGWTGALVVTDRTEAAAEHVRQAATLDASGNITAVIIPDDLPARGEYAYRLELVQGSAPPRFLLVGRFSVGSVLDV